MRLSPLELTHPGRFSFVYLHERTKVWMGPIARLQSNGHGAGAASGVRWRSLNQKIIGGGLRDPKEQGEKMNLLNRCPGSLV